MTSTKKVSEHEIFVLRTPFKHLSLEVAIHARYMFFQPRMLCSLASLVGPANQSRGQYFKTTNLKHSTDPCRHEHAQGPDCLGWSLQTKPHPEV